MTDTKRDELAEVVAEAAGWEWPEVAAEGIPSGLDCSADVADAILAVYTLSPTDEAGDHMTRPEWDEWSNQLAGHMGDRWDDDVAQEAIVTRFVEHYGTLDNLINELDYEGEVDEVVTITHNRETGKFTIVGVGPAAVTPEAKP